MSVRLLRFMECSGMLPTTQFAYWKGQDTCDALLFVSYTLQNALECGQELGSCRLILEQALIGSTIREFSIGSALWVLEVLLSTLAQFLSNRSQHVMVDGGGSKLVNI